MLRTRATLQQRMEEGLWQISIVCVMWMTGAGSVGGMEHVVFQQAGETLRASGRVLVAAQDGGIMLESVDGQIWTLDPDQIKLRTTDDQPFAYLSRGQLAETLLQNLPAGFKIHDTRNYLICYNTSGDYARWCGALFEKLHRAFFNFWGRKGLRIERPDTLVAIVFRDRRAYQAYAQPELGDAAESVIGYYSLATNRVATFDLTGVERHPQRRGNRFGSLDHIRMILSRPEARATVATVIHEATHQLCFNSNLQRRFADNPLWLSEGLAIYFESPDLTQRRGWRKIGALNASRLRTFRRYARRRPPDSLFTLFTSSQRFRDTELAPAAYAEAWALCYYLLRHRTDGFIDYLKTIQEKPYLGQDGPEQRIRDVEQALGVDWQTLDNEFIQNVADWE